MDNKNFEKISKALADPHRIKILEEFKPKLDYLHCSRIHEILNMTQPSISHHVKQLVDAGILEHIKEGRNVKYALNADVLEAYAAHVKAFMP
jgi:ArsR family transcriptional regulator